MDSIINFEQQHNSATETEPSTSNSRPHQETEAELSEFLVVRSSATSARADSGDEFENSTDSSPKSSQTKKGKAGGKGRVVKRTGNAGNSLSRSSDPVVKAKPSTSGLQKKKAKADIKNVKDCELLRMLKPVGKAPAKQNAKPRVVRKKRAASQAVENTALPKSRPQAVQEVALQRGTVNAAPSQPEVEEGDYEILNVFSQDDERGTVRGFLNLARQTKRDEEDRRRKLEDAAVELRARRVERERELATRQRLLDELRLVEARIRAKEQEIQQAEECVRSRRIDLDRATQKLGCIGEILNRLEPR